MSSDSDSDICDFTTDVSKQMAKGENQFWLNFKKTKVNDIAHQPTMEDIVEIVEATTDNKTVKHNNEGNTSLDVERTDIQLKITNKLNELSEGLQMILEDTCKKRRRGKRRGTARRVQPITKKSNINPKQSNLSNSVVLSSDDETKANIPRVMENEELNPIVTVTVLWKSVAKNSFKVHKYQPLTCIVDHYSEQYNLDKKLLFFTLDDEHVKPEESSYVSLRLNDTKQLEGGVLPESYLATSQECVTARVEGDRTFKVQYSHRKNEEINVHCQKGDKMEIILWQIAKYINQPVENIKLYFDGSLMKPSTKILETDLEDGDCLDLEILNR